MAGTEYIGLAKDEYTCATLLEYDRLEAAPARVRQGTWLLLAILAKRKLGMQMDSILGVASAMSVSLFWIMMDCLFEELKNLGIYIWILG